MSNINAKKKPSLRYKWYLIRPPKQIHTHSLTRLRPHTDLEKHAKTHISHTHTHMRMYTHYKLNNTFIIMCCVNVCACVFVFNVCICERWNTLGRVDEVVFEFVLYMCAVKSGCFGSKPKKEGKRVYVNMFVCWQFDIYMQLFQHVCVHFLSILAGLWMLSKMWLCVIINYACVYS